MSSYPDESIIVTAFREWFKRKGAYVHPALRFVKGISGIAVHTAEDMPCDSEVVSCPFSLAITPTSCKHALWALSALGNGSGAQLEMFSEREIICTYMVVHWLLEEEERNDPGLERISALHFEHLPYLKMLPSAGSLRTPLHFNESELSLLRGTNLCGATIDRRSKWHTEWERCRTYSGKIRPGWEKRFTWERYLTAATYLSSRAFPSTILSPNPSLASTDTSVPVLLPGIDSLNHARAHRVSWVVASARFGSPPALSPSDHSLSPYQISLVIHPSAPARAELFNNYGPKPNAEFILGYGFSLPENPDDTMVLKIGGQPGSDASGRRWEVGRNAKGVEGLWEEMKAVFTSGSAHGEEEAAAEWEVELEAAETLEEMVGHKLTALPHILGANTEGVREDVVQMVKDYVEGQQDILHSLSAFADFQRESALAKAKTEGVELVYE